MTYNLNLNDRAFDSIINGTKKVEIRANTANNNYSKLNKCDLICFTNNKKQSIICEVLEINHYSTIEELFILEGTRYTTSSTNDFDEAVERINNLNGYKNEISKSGVYAIHINYLYNLDDIWKTLYKKAEEVLNSRNISSNIEVGGVAAALLTKTGKIYTGVCIDTACSIGMCAERNAISNMITNGESNIDKLVCIKNHNNIMMPCGVCREFMMQLGEYNKNTEILVNLEKNKTIKLYELLPNWWN